MEIGFEIEDGLEGADQENLDQFGDSQNLKNRTPSAAVTAAGAANRTTILALQNGRPDHDHEHANIHETRMPEEMQINKPEPRKEIDFHHPFTPYDIQVRFMETVYGILERGEGGVGILESPTGTGKSLSLICASLTWLRDHKRRALEDGLNWDAHADHHDDNANTSNRAADEDEPEWVVQATRERKRREARRRWEEREQRLARVREKEKEERERFARGEKGEMWRGVKRRRVSDGDEGGGEVGSGHRNGNGRLKEGVDEEEQFMLDDYESDGDDSTGPNGKVNGKSDLYSGLSAETLALMEKAGMNVGGISKEDEEDDEDEVKIFYCSRTHSQLTQFVNELRRVKIPPAIPPDLFTSSSPSNNNPDIQTSPLTEEFKHLTLGSRKNLCINPAVNTLHSVTAINERCLDLQQATDKSKKCPYLPTPTTQPLVHAFRDHTLASIRDIEDFYALGKELNICPYYASRAAIKPSEIITLPYNLLLQKSAREALGIDIRGHVVVIDEAHNLMGAVCEMHGVGGAGGNGIDLGELKKVRVGLGVYLQKFGRKLKGRNRVYVAQVVRVVDSLVGALEGRLRRGLESKQLEDVIDSRELLAGKGVDQVNLFKLMKYLQESKLARKLEGYIAWAEQQQILHSTTPNKPSTQITGKKNKSKPDSNPSAPLLQTIATLLPALATPTKEGQFLYIVHPSSTTSTPTISLKYTLLDPSPPFAEIVSSARAVILAGGTMSPMSDYTSHLLSYLPREKITTLSCGHVIPKENLCALTVGKGPTGGLLEFTHKRKTAGGDAMIDELGRVMLNVVTVVPDGVVAFFQSYKYLDEVVTRWKCVLPGAKQSLWERLNARKKVFMERKDSNNNNNNSNSGSGTGTEAGTAGDDLLTEYAKAIDANHGGLLLSVVGGKLSEGINFSDRLGRCVMVVGLPFPNIQSAEWRAKLAYIESATIERLSLASSSSSPPGYPAPSSSTPLTTQQPKTPGPITADIKEAGKRAAREFYENACMRAVNQCIGRAIRHRGDWAAILLVDGRFGNESVRGKLPGWIGGSVVVTGSGGIKDGAGKEKGFGDVMGGLGRFFGGKKVK